MNLVVLGGGVAATLVAFLVHSVFEVRPLVRFSRTTCICCNGA